MRWVIALFVASALVFSACGDDDPTEADPERPDITDIDDEVEGETIVAPTPTAVPAVIEPERLTYAVQEGDLLGTIAQTFDVPLAALIWVNDIENPDFISIGDEIVIPTAEDIAEFEATQDTGDQGGTTDSGESTDSTDSTDDGSDADGAGGAADGG